MRSNQEYPMFVIQDWHRLYAEALLETDPKQLPSKIMLAESSISNRVFELGECSMPTAENLDLARAGHELISLFRKLSPAMSVFVLPVQPARGDCAGSKMIPGLTIHFADGSL